MIDLTNFDIYPEGRIHYLTYISDAMKRLPDNKVLSYIGGDGYTFRQIAVEIEKLHIIFEKAGLKPGDKVAICGNNSPIWGAVSLAVITYRAVAVPILKDFRPESIESLVNHSESSLLFVDTEIYKTLDRKNLSGLKAIFSLTSRDLVYDGGNAELVFAVDKIETLFREKYPNFSIEDVHYPEDNFDEVCIINYTSGTSSVPKGVVLTNGNISANIQYAVKTIYGYEGGSIVSMLPMAHMFGITFGFLYQLASGCGICFPKKISSSKMLFDYLAAVKPYMILTVPLMIEKMFKTSVFPVVNKPFMKLMLRMWPSAKIIKKKLRKKIMNAFGGGMKILIIGGAPINEEVESWLKKLKIPYLVGYGMTECAPLISYQQPLTFKLGSCGMPIDINDVKINSEDPQHIVGEILVRGWNVMKGYYKNPEATASTFTEDGWLCTGDLGLIDESGNLFIKGRSKNMILTASGQNVYPEEIEEKLLQLPYVDECIVIQRGSSIVGLVYPDMEQAEKDGFGEIGVKSKMKDNLNKLNSFLPRYIYVSTLAIVKEPFEKNPKNNIKRYLYR